MYEVPYDPDGEPSTTNDQDVLSKDADPGFGPGFDDED